VKQNNLNSWLKINSWNLILTFAGIVASFAIANYRINTVEAKISEYPSYDYFELKFNTIDKSLNDLTTKLETHINIK
jgi:hypothetical protein